MINTVKATVLEAIAGRNRGLLADVDANDQILEAIATLESHMPIAEPLAATNVITGVWRLLYTTSNELLGINRLPFYSLNQIYQCIDTNTAKIYNIAEVTGMPGLDGLVSVVATFDAVSKKRVEVKFNRAVFGLQRFLPYRTPSQFIEQLETTRRFLAIDFRIPSGNQQGWLDVTYLDDTLRIGRGNQGSVFVLAKVKPEK